MSVSLPRGTNDVSCTYIILHSRPSHLEEPLHPADDPFGHSHRRKVADGQPRAASVRGRVGHIASRTAADTAGTAAEHIAQAGTVFVLVVHIAAVLVVHMTGPNPRHPPSHRLLLLHNVHAHKPPTDSLF